jgi:hypothetical protein
MKQVKEMDKNKWKFHDFGRFYNPCYKLMPVYKPTQNSHYRNKPMGYTELYGISHT